MNRKKRQADGADISCRKNQELTLEIVDMGTDGEGVGRVDGYTLFVKDALVGDVVQVKVIKTKKRFGYARLMQIIQPSPWRVKPACPVARQCGGCQLQHCSYEKQLAWKSSKIAECISRIGGIPVISDFSEEGETAHGNRPVRMESILRMDEPYHYRNKAQFPVGYDKNRKLVAGFYAARSHDIIPCTDCIIQHPCNHIILETILAFMAEYGITAYQEKYHTGLVRHIVTRVGEATGSVMVCLVINGERIPHQEELVQRLLHCPFGAEITGVNGKNCIPPEQGEQHELSTESKQYFAMNRKDSGIGHTALSIKSICLNVNTDNTNVILGKEVVMLYGSPYIVDAIGGIRYQISPQSFFQINPGQTVRLYETVLEYAGLKGSEVVWDLYCGIGTISLFLAQKAARVFGVEIIPQAVEDAKANAALNGFDNAEFFLGAAEDVVPQQYEKSNGALQADVVTLDPPRKGCDEKLLETVIQMGPERIVYVSCDPGTLARDLKFLCRNGYELKRVRGCDMFGHSGHVETVVMLSHKKPTA